MNQAELNSQVVDELYEWHAGYHFLVLMTPEKGGDLTFSGRFDQGTTARLLKKVWKALHRVGWWCRKC